MRFSAILFALFFAAAVPAAAAHQAKWTIMMFMNGDNSLELDAIDDFVEMANVGSTKDVNIVVQIDRYAAQSGLTQPDWSDTYRFRVGPKTQPIPQDSLQSLGEQNMVDGITLAEFVAWARHCYKADHYALIIWGHGNGYRRLDGSDVDSVALSENQKRKRIKLPQGTLAPPVRGTSTDETSDPADMLYTSEITNALRTVLGPDKRLDVIGFDTCLMGMVEVAYAMKDVADVMVASEELEPGEGWNYRLWLEPFVKAPASYDAKALGKLIVRSFADSMSANQDQTRTLAAVDLRKVDALTAALSDLGETLAATMPRQRDAVSDARTACRYYAAKGCDDGEADCVYHIDLRQFTDGLASSAKANATTKRLAQRVTDAVRQAIIGPPYAGSLRLEGFGSHGLAIYFPETHDQYVCDPIAPGAYFRINDDNPVAFVQNRKLKWVDFLQAYLQVRDGQKCGE